LLRSFRSPRLVHRWAGLHRRQAPLAAGAARACGRRQSRSPLIARQPGIGWSRVPRGARAARFFWRSIS